MGNCLNCGKPLINVEGRREKKYCDNNCKQKYWQRTKPKEEKRKILSMAQWEEIQSQLKAAKEIKITNLSKPNKEIKPLELPKTNYVINTDKKEMPSGLSKVEKFKWLKNNT